MSLNFTTYVRGGLYVVDTDRNQKISKNKNIEILRMTDFKDTSYTHFFGNPAESSKNIDQAFEGGFWYFPDILTYYVKFNPNVQDRTKIRIKFSIQKSTDENTPFLGLTYQHNSTLKDISLNTDYEILSGTDSRSLTITKTNKIGLYILDGAFLKFKVFENNTDGNEILSDTSNRRHTPGVLNIDFAINPPYIGRDTPESTSFWQSLAAGATFVFTFGQVTLDGFFDDYIFDFYYYDTISEIWTALTRNMKHEVWNYKGISQIDTVNDIYRLVTTRGRIDRIRWTMNDWLDRYKDLYYPGTTWLVEWDFYFVPLMRISKLYWQPILLEKSPIGFLIYNTKRSKEKDSDNYIQIYGWKVLDPDFTKPRFEYWNIWAVPKPFGLQTETYKHIPDRSRPPSQAFPSILLQDLAWIIPEYKDPYM